MPLNSLGNKESQAVCSTCAFNIHVVVHLLQLVSLTVESSVYRTLVLRSSGENELLFRARPLYSFIDAPSLLTDMRSPCQFNCLFLPSTINSGGVLSFQLPGTCIYPMTCFLHSFLQCVRRGIYFLQTESSRSHPLSDTGRDEASAPDVDGEVGCFPPCLFAFFNKGLIAILLPFVCSLDVVFMWYCQLHLVHFFL